MNPQDLPRGVVLAATPLGNMHDATDRLKQGLAYADVIAAEDTRRVRALAQALGIEIRGQVVSNFDHNEEQRSKQLIDSARTGTVLVVTDAGMPLVSDPGHSIVVAAAEAGVPVTCFPGASAVPTALALSGLSVGRFIFDGFAPRKSGQRKKWLESLQNEQRAVVFFESPHRLAETLAQAVEVLGAERAAVVCRELTKKFEEIKRGTLGGLAEWAVNNARGEITVVLDGGSEQIVSVESLLPEVEKLVSSGMRLKDACKHATEGTGVSNRDLYQAALENS
ncbi:16S rRNA (cytidine(1402)-2'-O)-methyltransferase [Corynebacterium sp. L4756]|uniref:16S rRNA (cytidine(1402)-2'-O)-methyltransferase n=1 Tax=unclassified Corynebacterium TaxID=2624378 RepID=UPI00374D3CD9